MRNTKEITELIKQYETDIINRIDYESIDVYKFLKNEFQKGDVRENYLFQFVFRSFYRLDNAGLTDELKKEYFIIMQEARELKNVDPVGIVQRLYSFKRRKGDNSIQFSFTTKLINMINEDYPIYDSEVARVFGFSNYYIKDNNRKIEKYLVQQEIIKKTYKDLIDNASIQSTLHLFDNKFINNNLPDTKKIDFVFWACGKVFRV